MSATQYRWSLARWWRHLIMTHAYMRAVLPKRALDAITAHVKASEQTHGGQIRVAVEADLPTPVLWRGISPRERAVDVFAALHVWDTQGRNGVLIYLCLADHAVEIVADRGLQGRVSDDEWSAICRQLEAACATKRHAAGLCEAVAAAGRLVARHFPHTTRNEQDDRPVLM